VTPAAERAIRAVLAHEGGYVDDARDPGGATNRGITIAVLADFRGKPVTKDDVRNLSEAEACAIYLHRYWMPIRGDELHPAVAFATMDAAVNSGVSRAARWLQQAVGVAADGVVGPRTIGAAAKADPAHVVQTCCAERLAFLQSLKTWPTFGRGWERRVREVEAAALGLIA
jgi:lysozyme family protein